MPVAGRATSNNASKATRITCWQTTRIRTDRDGLHFAEAVYHDTDRTAAVNDYREAVTDLRWAGDHTRRHVLLQSRDCWLNTDGPRWIDEWAVAEEDAWPTSTVDPTKVRKQLKDAGAARHLEAVPHG